MRRLVLALLASTAPLLASATPAGAAAGETRTQHFQVTDGPQVVPAGAVCPFELDISFPFQDEYETKVFDASGRLVEEIFTGPLVADFRNAATGATVERNLSGMGEFFFNPDRSLTIVFDGHLGARFFVGSSPSGEYLVFSGHGVIDIATTGVRTLEQLDGTAEDICQTLAS